MRGGLVGIAFVVALMSVAGASPAGNARLRLISRPVVLVKRPTVLTIRASRPQPESQLRLVLIAPQASLMDVVGAAANERPIKSAVEVPGGFTTLARRFSATAWNVRVTFPSAGRWRVVVPDWTLKGFTTPFPALVSVHVQLR